MINIVQNGPVYQITFRYDPELVALVKNVPDRRWNPEAKMWTIPTDRLGWLLAQLKDTPYKREIRIVSTEHIDENAQLGITEQIPEEDISDVDINVQAGGHLYQHQIDFLKYAVHRDKANKRSGFILADEPGAGKTLEVTNLALYYRKKYGFKHCLIICCVNTAKYNWCEDIIKHTNGVEKPYILGSRMRRNGTVNCTGGSKDKLKDLQTGKMYGKADGDDLPYFLILNIEALRYKEGKLFPITAMIAEWINTHKIGIVGIDEIHHNASPKSMQGRQLVHLKADTGSNVCWIPITGTPIINKPTDVYLPLKLIDGHSYSSFYTWCEHFCVYGGYGDHEVVGYKNMPYLKNMLQGNMLRRLKKDFIDLPPKVYHVEYVENTPYQEKLYAMVLMELQNERGSILQAVNPMAKFLRLRQVNGSPELIDSECKVDDNYLKKSAKLQRLLELLDDAAAAGEKTIVYSNWVEPLRTLYKFVSQRYKTCCYTGTMPEAERQHHKEVFMNNPSYTVMLGTIAAMGTSHTLTAASNVIFYDEPWTPADREQAIDRVHRPGTTHTVNIYSILTRDTVDDKVHNILYTKQGISEYLVDNRLDFKQNPQLVDLLLGHK